MNIIPDKHRRLIEASTEAAFARLTDPDNPRKRCLIWAMAAEESLLEFGYYACMNAGTANWQANHAPKPTPTHVGHFWQDLSDQTICDLYLSHGVLPEMHCWAALPKLGVIYDPTTGWVKELANECGIPWTQDDPDDHSWLTVDSLPEGWMYLADQRATILAYQLAQNIRMFGTGRNLDTHCRTPSGAPPR